MPETARAHPVRSIRRPEFSPTRHNGRRDEEDAAWFYEGIYTLNREINVTLHTKWIAGEWRRRAVSLYTDTKKAKAMSNELLTPRLLQKELKKGETYWGENPPTEPATTAVVSTYIMILPNQCHNYALFAQACVALNMACQPSQELICEAFRLAFPLLVDLEGEPPESAIEKAIPRGLELYHQGIRRSRALLYNNRAAEYAEEPLERCTNGELQFPIDQNSHNMIHVDADSRIIPLARLPLEGYPGIDWSRLYKPHDPSTAKLNFWHMFEALNPWAKSECQETNDKIWEVAVRSNWATLFKMKGLGALEDGAGSTTDYTADNGEPRKASGSGRSRKGKERALEVEDENDDEGANGGHGEGSLVGKRKAGKSGRCKKRRKRSLAEDENDEKGTNGGHGENPLATKSKGGDDGRAQNGAVEGKSSALSGVPKVDS
ncbi:MAG: hypothetical protein FRX48_07238 [Lasallia pustulata]|uniref:Uncharacterized protein n=1 Tax=Lasallia pustulata TaxID=136370 RepID=A0A5M8PJE2_9LECA|nr:MAG: hypothetical protein FRX48_07238 [Lasallia pustulata]